MPTDQELKDISLEILRDLGACPAISFMEEPVAAYVQRYLRGLGVCPRNNVLNDMRH